MAGGRPGQDGQDGQDGRQNQIFSLFFQFKYWKFVYAIVFLPRHLPFLSLFGRRLFQTLVPMARPSVKLNVFDYLKKACRERILILDGAMGTVLQEKKLSVEQIKGHQFKDHTYDTTSDILNITQPEIIQSVHEDYLEAGADIIETNTFNATSVCQSENHLEKYCYEMNRAGAELASNACKIVMSRDKTRPRFVAGSIGPTHKFLSISPRMDAPAYRAITYDEMVDTYSEQARGLLDGGVDILLIETVPDSLNAKAAIYAIEKLFASGVSRVPLMLAMTLEKSGRILSGQTVESFCVSVAHSNPLAIGINCGMGPQEMLGHLNRLSRACDSLTIAYPNAGIPVMGEYLESPESIAEEIKEFATNGAVNIVGSCCGSTPAFTRAIAEAVRGISPRVVPESSPLLHLSGINEFIASPKYAFINVGERCNVSGSKVFLKYIQEGNYDKAVKIARDQVNTGAQLIDVCVDDSLIDGEKTITHFLNLLAGETEITSVPFILDSSNFNVLKAALRCVQGKPIVNSISLKNGEEEFLSQANELHLLGAAMIVMAFDEKGQAVTRDRKVEICRRAYNLLTRQLKIPEQDIIFDLNILPISTGMESDYNHAVDFIEATRILRQEYPNTNIIGGVSNLSFSFRGHNVIRQTIHSVFLYHAIRAGMKMGIVNARELPGYTNLDPEIKPLVEDLVLNRKPYENEQIMEKLFEIAKRGKDEEGNVRKKAKVEAAWRTLKVGERLRVALVKGSTDYLEIDIDEARKEFESQEDPLPSLQVIEKHLMEGMSTVGKLFGSGQMFLPQVIKSARVMNMAVGFLMPYLERERVRYKKLLETPNSRAPTPVPTTDEVSYRGTILLATVKGDVHDIGKNIVMIVLRCNNYKVVDIGVRCECDSIIEAIEKEKADFVGLSGLITPSIDEMSNVAKEMEKRGMKIPLLIGGAAASKEVAAIKIAPLYSGPCVYVSDASQAPLVVNTLLQPNSVEFISNLKHNQEELRKQHFKKTLPIIPLQQARERKTDIDWVTFSSKKPTYLGVQDIEISLDEIIQFIDWGNFYNVFQIARGVSKTQDSEATKVYVDAKKILDKIRKYQGIKPKACIGFFQANSVGDDIIIFDPNTGNKRTTLNTIRQQFIPVHSKSKTCAALADLIAPLESGHLDYIGLFALSTGHGLEKFLSRKEYIRDDYSKLLVKSLGDVLAEAMSEYMHLKVRRELWGYASDENVSHSEILNRRWERGNHAYDGIRPAFGYPCHPDHTMKEIAEDLLSIQKRKVAQFTETWAMQPASSVCGMYFSHPKSLYFAVGKIDHHQLTDYAARRKKDVVEMYRWLSPIIYKIAAVEHDIVDITHNPIKKTKEKSLCCSVI